MVGDSSFQLTGNLKVPSVQDVTLHLFFGGIAPNWSVHRGAMTNPSVNRMTW